MSTAGRLLALSYVIAALLVMQALRVHSHQDHVYHDDHFPEHTHSVQVHLAYIDGAADDAVPEVDLTSKGIVDDDSLPPLMLALLAAALTWPLRRPAPAQHPGHAPRVLRYHPASTRARTAAHSQQAISTLSLN
jgi:hypothetical protein